MSTKEEEILSWSEVTTPLTQGQKDFLYGRLMDMTESEALRLAGRKRSSLRIVWRRSEFKEIEKHVLKHKEHYKKEASQDFISGLTAKAQKGLERLADMGLRWDTVKKEDKSFALRAMQIIAGYPSKKGGGGYEEEIFKKREEE